MAQRVKITVEVEVDLDMVPGWGYTPKTWIDMIKTMFGRQSHYNPFVSIAKIEACDRTGVPHEVTEDFCGFSSGKALEDKQE